MTDSGIGTPDHADGDPGAPRRRRAPASFPSSDPRRRGRIDPMGRVWSVRSDHATTGGSPPVPATGERLARARLGCGYSAASELMGARLVPSPRPPPSIGASAAVTATGETSRRRRPRLFLDGGLLVRVILGLAASQGYSVAVAAACEGHRRVKRKR